MAHIPEDFKTYSRANGIVEQKKNQKMVRNAVFSTSLAMKRQYQKRVTTAGSRAWKTPFAPPSGLVGTGFGGKRLKPIVRGGNFDAGPIVIRTSTLLANFSGDDYINYKKTTEFSK